MMSFASARALVERVTQPGSPNLYRKLYGLEANAPALTVPAASAWEALPFVEKDVLLATPLSERLFAPMSDVDHFRASSGTSGNPPLFCPRTYLRGMEYRTEYHNFAKPILAFGVPAMPHWHEHFQSELGQTPHAIVFDPKNAAASVRLAKLAGADAISVFAFHIPLIGPHAEREGWGEQVRFIEIAGEACSRAMFEYMRRVFPNAAIIPFYGSSEVEDSPMGMPCRAITGEEPLALYHAKESQYHELIEPDTGAVVVPESGAEGELVITAYPGEPSAFPLVRYRTGDMVRVVDVHCARHGSWSFTILGRVASDFLKIQGGVLRADEMERVLRRMEERVTDRFEMHRIERDTREGPKLALEVFVEPRSSAANLEVLAGEIAAAFRVSPQRTYADGVATGLYAPLVCRKLESLPAGKKHKRIVSG